VTGLTTAGLCTVSQTSPSQELDQKGLPLQGITVVACEHAVAAPFATRQLADLGARVIKIERPVVGDFARAYDEAVKGQSSHFVWLNRSKESVTLNLKDAAARAVLERLVSESDVFVQNLAPGAADRLGLGAEELTRKYERLIHCTVSGYGEAGPLREAKAYDLLIQAETGMISLTGSPGQCVKAGIPVADIAAGMYAFSGILAALFHRERTGRGKCIHVSLFDSLSEWMSHPLYYTKYGQSQPVRAGASHATIAPYGPFATSDGPPVVLAVQNDREWRSFCKIVLARPDLADDIRFNTNSNRLEHRSQLHELVDEVFSQMTREEVLGRLELSAIGYAHLNDVTGLINHPQLSSRNRWRTVETPAGHVDAILPAIGYDNSELQMGPVPALGEHTDDVLRSLGLSESDVHGLRAAGAV